MVPLEGGSGSVCTMEASWSQSDMMDTLTMMDRLKMMGRTALGSNPPLRWLLNKLILKGACLDFSWQPGT